MCRMLKFEPASAGHEEVVRELLGAGANVKKTNDKGLTALWVQSWHLADVR